MSQSLAVDDPVAQPAADHERVSPRDPRRALQLALAALREYGLEFLPVTIAIILLLYIPLIWIGLALGAKRLHDRDKSAWWLLVFYALPTILSSRRSNGGCAIHHPASHQLRNYRLGLR